MKMESELLAMEVFIVMDHYSLIITGRRVANFVGYPRGAVEELKRGLDQTRTRDLRVRMHG